MAAPFRILLIAPITDGFQGKQHFFSFPFMALPTVAGRTPEGMEVEIVFEKHQDIPYEADVDLVGITVLTPLAPHAYDIAKRFRSRGIPVVLGGVHPTVLPEEASQHADAICVGEGDNVWGDICRDAAAGELKALYEDPERFERNFSVKTPRRDLMPVGRYMGGMLKAIFMETARGCPFDCDFCAVTTFFGQRIRMRSVDEIEAEFQEMEIRQLKPGQKRSFLHNIVAFTDDNFFLHQKHAVEVLEMLRRYDLRWFGQTTLRLAEKPELLELCRESGCLGFEVGFESLANNSYKKTGIANTSSRAAYYLERIQTLHKHGLGINGSFIFGNDDDDLGVFERYADFVQEAKIETPYFTILTPYPGVPIHHQMEAEGRLLHKDWSLYDTAHAVFQPKNMTPEQLEAGYRWAWRKVTRHGAMLSRTLGAGSLFRFWGPAALGFRFSVRAEHRRQVVCDPRKLPQSSQRKALPAPLEHLESPGAQQQNP